MRHLDDKAKNGALLKQQPQAEWSVKKDYRRNSLNINKKEKLLEIMLLNLTPFIPYKYFLFKA